MRNTLSGKTVLTVSIYQISTKKQYGAVTILKFILTVVKENRLMYAELSKEAEMS